MVGGVAIKKESDTLSSSGDQNRVVSYLMKERETYARQQKHDYSHVFRRKTVCELFRLASIAMAIEFAYAAETAFVSPILLQIGIDHKHMTMAWALSPIIGFFVSPLLGSVSDRCKLNWGRRRPIITILSIGIVLGLILVPYGKEIGKLFGDAGTATGSVAEMTHFKYAAALTIIGMVLLDLCADTCQTPARTYLLDMCVPDDQSKALTMFTLFAGFGGCIGYAIGGIDWENTNIGSVLGGNIPTVFGIVTIIFIICFFVTITTFREIPLSLIEKDPLLRPISDDDIKKEERKSMDSIYYIKQTTALELEIAKAENDERDRKKPSIEKYTSTESYQNGGYTSRIPNKPSTTSLQTTKPNVNITLGAYLKSIFVMPYSIRILAVTNLFCWMGHVTYCLYFTDFVGEAVFHGDPMALPGTPGAINYEAGLRYGCWGMSIYALSCAVYSMVVGYFMRLVGARLVYIIGILYYAVCMLILGIWPTKWGVLFFSTSAGILYGTLFTMPYILVANYHSKNCFNMCAGEIIPLKHPRGLGTDVSIISSMVFIAQFFVALTIGPLVAWTKTTCTILFASSALSFIAAFCAIFVLYV